MKKIVLASGNAGKIKEFQAIFQDTTAQLMLQTSLGVSDVEETGLTFIENALLKARHANKMTGKPAIADDSGLVVPALAGAPGIFSARYAGEHGNDEKNNLLLLKNMKDVNDRRAFFVCNIVYLEHEKDPLPLIAQGLWYGEIIHELRGKNGFGYNPVFRPCGETLTVAEMSVDKKNAQSHRGQALRQFITQYQARYG